MTTTATGNYVCDNSSLANFKSWAQAISNAFSAFGWTQTADTGQVNWGSIAAVPSSAYVYEIWKTSDALSSTLPIYVRIEYGFSTTSPRMQVTVGTGSNGSGTITGQVISSAPWALTVLNANQGATTYPCYFSGSTGEFRMVMWNNPTASPGVGTVLVIERSKDSSGANTADYFTVACCNQQAATAATFQQTNTPSAIGNRETGIIGVALTSGSGTGLANGTVAALPVLPIIGKVGNQMLGMMTAANNDAAANTTVNASSMYGATHAYIVIAATAISQAVGSRAAVGTTMVLLVRYE